MGDGGADGLGVGASAEFFQCGGELVHRWRLKQRAQANLFADRLAELGGKLGGQQRMPAEFEEVAAATDGWQSEHLGHRLRHQFFHRCARRLADIGRRRVLRVRCRQRLAVDLAVGQQRQRRHAHEVARHHVVRKRATQEVAQRLRIECHARSRNHVGDQPHITRLVFAGDDDAAANTRKLAEPRLDLAELDAIAADLDLVVLATHVFQRARFGPASEVTRAVDVGRTTGIERVTHKAVGVQFGAFQVTQRHAGAADADLTRVADRAHLALVVEHPHRGVGNRFADRYAFADLGEAAHRAPHRRFRRSVQVPQVGAGRDEACRQRRRQGLGPRPQFESGGRPPAGIQQQVATGRRGLHDSDGVVFHHAHQHLRVGRVLAWHQHDPGTGHQRQHHLGHGHVERECCQCQHAVVGHQARLALHAAQQVAHTAMVQHHTLGSPGRSGGVDHVDQGVVGQRRRRRRCHGRHAGDQSGVVVQAQLQFARHVDQAGVR